MTITNIIVSVIGGLIGGLLGAWLKSDPPPAVDEEPRAPHLGGDWSPPRSPDYDEEEDDDLVDPLSDEWMNATGYGN